MNQLGGRTGVSKSSCSPASKPITAGYNVVLFSELTADCSRTADPSLSNGEPEKAALMQVSWDVITNPDAPVPFDFCLTHIRALLE